MGTVRVTINVDGIDSVIANLDTIDAKGQDNLVSLTKELADDTEAAWQAATPRRSGKLQGADIVDPVGLTFTLQNDVYYYKFVDEGHWTPRGWRIRTKHGWVFRWAKRRSHVEGREMTRSALDFVRENINDYLSQFLDNA